jgi:hypothetical protein
MIDGDPDLRTLLEALDPKTRDDLRRVLIHDQSHRDAIASQLLRYRGGKATIGRHDRHADDVSGCAAAGCAAARRD